MNKTQLIETIAKETNLKKREVEAVVEALSETVMKTVAGGEKVQITGFGSFERKIRKERMVKIPSTKKEQLVPETKVPSFSAGSIFKEKVAK